jgi:hypothetical protein
MKRNVPASWVLLFGGEKSWIRAGWREEDEKLDDRI